MKPLQAIEMSNAGLSLAPSAPRPDRPSPENSSPGVTVQTMKQSTSPGRSPAYSKRRAPAATSAKSLVASVRPSPMPAFHSGSRGDPLVGRVEPLLEIDVGHDVWPAHGVRRRRSSRRPATSQPRSSPACSSRISMTWRPAYVPQRLACKVRPLRLVALRTLHRRHRVQFPVCRPAAARLTARCFPF